VQISIIILCGNPVGTITDQEVYRGEMDLVKKADTLGFDAIWAPEHHFDTYCMCPDNTQILSYLAGQTKNMKLGIGAAIMPWHDPLRVIEKVSLLDILSEGRVLLAFGRGLAKLEYDGWRQNMSESRERFNESTRAVVEALERGVAEYHGKFYDQPRVDIHPFIPRSFKDRVFGIAMSPESVEPVADLGATMMTFVQGPIEQHLPGIVAHREQYQRKHGRLPDPAVLVDFTYCHDDPAEAERGARDYLSTYFSSVVKHYNLLGNDLAGVKGYTSWDEASKMMRQIGKETVLQTYVEAMIWGTPQQILDKFEQRYAKCPGGFSPTFCFSFGGMPFAKAEASMRLFAKKVLPELRRIDKTSSRAA